jgi:hypothetical protein
MAKARKIFLLRERRETWRMRTSRETCRARCPNCNEVVGWLTVAEAARTARLTELEVFRLAENGGIHYAESEAGSLFICGRSLE